ncbi:MAG: hypothetical protein M0P69_04460 [Bacteroidales bacterium]|nr:hypothetical protein [Bacteroidales bacterium]
MRKIIELKDLPAEKFPLIVLVDNRSGTFLSSRIKSHSKGNYNHIACFISPTEIASQDPQGYRKVDAKKYFVEENFLKFWRVKTSKQREWQMLIESELGKPGIYSGYDFLGIAGQFLYSIIKVPWFKKINNPIKKYCSERESIHLRYLFGFDLPAKPSPSDLNRAFHDIPQLEVAGYWFDEEA